MVDACTQTDDMTTGTTTVQPTTPLHEDRKVTVEHAVQTSGTTDFLDISLFNDDQICQDEQQLQSIPLPSEPQVPELQEVQLPTTLTLQDLDDIEIHKINVVTNDNLPSTEAQSQGATQGRTNIQGEQQRDDVDNNSGPGTSSSDGTFFTPYSGIGSKGRQALAAGLPRFIRDRAMPGTIRTCWPTQPVTDELLDRVTLGLLDFWKLVRRCN